MTRPRSPSLERLASIARELGDLAERVVFIGGAVAPLLQSHPPFPRARVTSDVDGVIGSTTYAELERLQDQLTARGFRQGPDGAHMHRWIAPDGIPFDLIPSGDHPGGSGNPWDAVALETALELELEDGLVIRHVGAPAFLAQKWSAHHDRGRNDPLTSHDLEDILALLASRPGIAEEVAAAPIELSAYLGQQARAFLNDPDAEDLLAAHLNNAQDPAFTIEAVRVVLRRLAAFF